MDWDWDGPGKELRRRNGNLAPQTALVYLLAVIIVRFPDEGTQKEALAVLIGHYSGHSWATAEVLVPEEALAPLASGGIKFTAEGRVTAERILSLRNTPSVAT
jgi:hypothetical protein